MFSLYCIVFFFVYRKIMISDVNFGLIFFTVKLEPGDSFSLLWLYVILTLSLSTKICSDISVVPVGLWYQTTSGGEWGEKDGEAGDWRRGCPASTSRFLKTHTHTQYKTPLVWTPLLSSQDPVDSRGYSCSHTADVGTNLLQGGAVKALDLVIQLFGQTQAPVGTPSLLEGESQKLGRQKTLVCSAPVKLCGTEQWPTFSNLLPSLWITGPIKSWSSANILGVWGTAVACEMVGRVSAMCWFPEYLVSQNGRPSVFPAARHSCGMLHTAPPHPESSNRRVCPLGTPKISTCQPHQVPLLL